MRLWFPVAEKLLQRSLEKWTSFLKLFETSVLWRQSACNSYRNFSLNIVKTGQNLISAYWEVAMTSRETPRKQLWTVTTFITKIFNLVLDKFWVNRFWIFVILPKSYNFISIYGQKFPSQSSWQRDHDIGFIYCSSRPVCLCNFLYRSTSYALFKFIMEIIIASIKFVSIKKVENGREATFTLLGF